MFVEHVLDETFWLDFCTTDRAINQFIRSLPSIHDRYPAEIFPMSPRHSLSPPSSPSSMASTSSPASSPSPPPSPSPADRPVNLFLLVLHSLSRSAMIELHNGLALAGDQASYNICLKFAREVAALVYKITGPKGEDIPFFLQVCSLFFFSSTQALTLAGLPSQLYWARILRVLSREFVRLRRVGEFDAANAVWNELDNLLVAINRTVGASTTISRFFSSCILVYGCANHRIRF